MTRRPFSTLLLLLTFLVPPPVAAERPSLEDQPGLAEYRAYVGETFAVYGGRGGRWVEHLTLERIEDLSHPGEPVEQFRLVFLGRADSSLQKDSYRAEHPEAGRFRLFLDPGPVTGDRRELYMDMVLLKKGAEIR